MISIRIHSIDFKGRRVIEREVEKAFEEATAELEVPIPTSIEALSLKPGQRFPPARPPASVPPPAHK